MKLRANDWSVKPDGASALVWGTGCDLVHFTVLYLSLIEVLVDQQNHIFEKIRS